MPEPVDPSESADHERRERDAKPPPPALLEVLAAAAVFVAGAVAVSGEQPPLPFMLLFAVPWPLLLVDRVIIDDLSSLEVETEEEPEVISRTDEADIIDAESLPDEFVLCPRCSFLSSSKMDFVVAAIAAASLVLRSLEAEACCCCCCWAAERAATAARARSLAIPAALARHCTHPSWLRQTGGKRAGA